MTDVMLPQVAQPQVVAKPVTAVAKSPEVTQETESNQGFSNVLKERMQPEKGGETKVCEKSPTEGGAENKASRASAEDSADGKVLPQTGNPEDSLIAVLTTQPQPQPAPVEAATDTAAHADDAIDTGTIFPDQSAMLAQVPVSPVVPGDGVQVSAVADGVVPTLPSPTITTARTDLPESTQSRVAQAVRDAITNRDAAALTQQNQQAQQPQQPALERFGADVRAFVAAQQQQRGPGFEALLDRVVIPAQHGQSTTALPQGLHAVLPQDATAATARPTLPTTTVETPFRQSGWDQALSERVLWAANQKLQSAEIKLNPPQLGPIEVRVQMHHDQAQVSFTAQHATVRDALEAAMPRLREMFSASGFDLVDVNVSQHSFADQQRQAQGFGTQIRGGHSDDDDAAITAGPQQELSRAGGLSRSGIDLFA